MTALFRPDRQNPGKPLALVRTLRPAEAAGSRIWAITLVSRATGKALSIDGIALTWFAKNREDAIQELMDGRDPQEWMVRAVTVPNPAEGIPGECAEPDLPHCQRNVRPPFAVPGSWAWHGVIGAVTGALIASAPVFARADAELLNVSYDPTRELYRDYNELFLDWWQDAGSAPVSVQQSHGGSGAQARAVIDGLEAQVVTLALSADIDAIAERTGKIPEDWQSRLPHNSSPYTSTIVFLVREGNPDGIEDWDDLAADGIEVITPNPKTSGGARWNFLAAWAYADRAYDGDETQVRDYISALYRNVPVLDTGARGSTTTFAQRGIGDVLLAWENEAFLALEEFGDDRFDIVVPSISIRAEPPVTLVDGNITSDEQQTAAKAYLEHLYSPEAQAIALKHYYRAWDTSAAAPEDIARFPEVEMVTIADFGGWAEAQPAFFGEGGVFDQIYEGR